MNVTERSVESEAGTPQRLLAVPLSTLGATQTIEFNLYLRHDKHSRPLLFRERRLEYANDDLARLAEQGLKFLYIDEDDYNAYQRYLRENLSRFVSDPERPLARRIEFLGELARDSLRHAFECGTAAAIVQEAHRLATHLAELATSRDLLVFDLFSLLRHDFCAFTHSFNVAAYTLTLARGLGWSNATELRDLAAGGMLHDIGKLAVPVAILTKKGPLSDAEKRLLRQHPQDGFERLCKRPDVTWGQLMMVYQHHERIDGRGYPVGLPGGEIHAWARLAAVCNAFDNHTSARPFQTTLTPESACQELERASGASYDAEMVRCWKHLCKNSTG